MGGPDRRSVRGVTHPRTARTDLGPNRSGPLGPAPIKDFDASCRRSGPRSADLGMRTPESTVFAFSGRPFEASQIVPSMRARLAAHLVGAAKVRP